MYAGIERHQERAGRQAFLARTKLVVSSIAGIAGIPYGATQSGTAPGKPMAGQPPPDNYTSSAYYKKNSYE
jgi:hypothetical protein